MIYPIRGTYRAYAGADTPIEAWVRDESGPADLSGVEVEVQVKRGDNKLMTLPATGDASGKVAFSITASNVTSLCGGGSFWLLVLADGQVVHTGLLEVVR